MTDQKDNPHFLVLQKYHLSKDLGRKTVISALERCEIPRPKDGWDTLNLTWKDGQPPISVSFRELVDEARRTGIAGRLQEHLDKCDPIFGGAFADVCIPNHQMKCSREYAGWRKEVQGPCRTSCVERDLTEDILYYRREACERSDEYDFRVTARAFRSYLSVCVSLLDAFINRHILLAQHDGFSSPEFDRLKVETNLEEKVRLWWAVCSEDDPASFFQSAAWNHLQQLRTKRNEILHAVEPISIYSLKEIGLYLNLVRTGIGELLLQLRRAHQKPTLGFIERLRTAPKVDFHQITFRADGKHEIKVIAR